MPFWTLECRKRKFDFAPLCERVECRNVSEHRIDLSADERSRAVCERQIYGGEFILSHASIFKIFCIQKMCVRSDVHGNSFPD